MLTISDFETVVKEREALFINLYKKCFPLTARYVGKMGGSLEQAQDVFQDALVIYYEKVRAGAVTINSGEKAYIYGITKYLWIKRYKEQNRVVPFMDNIELPEPYDKQPSAARLLHYLEAAGEKCMNLLRAFYYDKTKLEDIAASFGFSGVRSATVQKFKCLEKVKEKIKAKSLAYEDFLE